MQRQRLQAGAGQPLSLPQSPTQLNDGSPPHPILPDSLPDSLPQQENFLMVEATRRTVILPSLSIVIPPSPTDEDQNSLREAEDDQEAEQHDDIETSQVTSLATEESEGEDTMSEQSSICQSPSWEGYGQRKKEKKLEAERRKKEKEQAEKEAKAARKRNTARLSKPPPAPATAAKRDSKIVGLTNADRSMSDPVLVTQHRTGDSHRPEDVSRAASADDLHKTRQQRPSVTEVLSSSAHILVSCSNVRKSVSEGPASLSPQPSPTSSSKPEPRSPRDAFPPSASRTPRLRHMSPSGGNRSSSLLQAAATNSGRSQESLSASSAVDGGPRDGYVLYQRAQAAERALESLEDEQLAGDAGPRYPPTSNATQIQSKRRRSLTQEAKSAAMKLVGIKAAPAAKDEARAGNRPSSQSDYLTFKAIRYSASSPEPEGGRQASSHQNRDDTHQVPINQQPPTSETAVSRRPNAPEEISTHAERLHTSRSPVVSSGPSTTSSALGKHKKKKGGLREAAKAALTMSKGSQKPQDGSAPSISVPPYFALRARMQSRASAPLVKDAPPTPPEDATAAVAVSPVAQCPQKDNTNTLKQNTVTAPQTEPSKQTETEAQGGCHASERSSSSSAYEDVSLLPSPTTTPNTSRPQSAKDVSLLAKEFLNEDSESLGLQDDERTLRQSLNSSKSSTPRMIESEVRESTNTRNEDRWSRTLLPSTINSDAQSFNSPVSNSGKMDNADQTLLNSPSSLHATSQPNEAAFAPLSLGKLSFNFDFASGNADGAMRIPPRSSKRDLATVDRFAADLIATSPSHEQWGDNMAPAHGKNVSEENGRLTDTGGENADTRDGGNSLRDLKRGDGNEKRGKSLERYKRKSLQNHRMSRKFEQEVGAERGREDEIQPSRSRAPSAGSTPPARSPLASEFGIPSNPYLLDFSEALKSQGIPAGTPRSANSLHNGTQEHAAQPSTYPGPNPPSESPPTSGASTPSRRTSGTPISILKNPNNSTPDLPPTPPESTSPRPQALSSLPKHMQAGIPARPPTTTSGAEARRAPIAKMFVECCSCKFYHDMPSKIYECMAKPDTVVEDRTLGISGAITTMVKCPWCHHNMSRNCCAGYAAVVYLKERLH